MVAATVLRGHGSRVLFEGFEAAPALDKDKKEILFTQLQISITALCKKVASNFRKSNTSGSPALFVTMENYIII